MLIALLLVGALGFLACSGEGDDGKRARCEQLRAHVADLTVARAGRSLPADERQKHARNLEASAGEEYIASCVAGRSEASIECALAAKTMDEVGRCMKSD